MGTKICRPVFPDVFTHDLMFNIYKGNPSAHMQSALSL